MSSRLLLPALLLFVFGCGLGVERVGAPPSAGQPFVVLLHGHGAPGDDLVGLAKELSEQLPEASFIVLAGPNGAGGGRTWVPSFRTDTKEEAVVKLEELVSSASAKIWARIEEARKAGVECADIVIAGFSLGGRMAAEAALRGPEDCAVGGIVVMGGGGLNDVELPAADQHARMRVLVAHGRKDSVVSYRIGQATARHFASAGHDATLLSFDGGHQIAPPVREGLIAFLRKERVGQLVDWP